MRIQSVFAVTTALTLGFAANALAGTIPIGASTGAADYHAADPTAHDDCPCGAFVLVGDDVAGTWTLSAGQVFTLGPGAPHFNETIPFLGAGRFDAAGVGTVTVTGAGSNLTLSGDDTGVGAQIGWLGGTGTLNVHDGGVFSMSDPNSANSDNDNALRLGESGGTGTLDVDQGTVSIETGQGANLDVGAAIETGDPTTGGHGIVNLTDSVLTLRDLANAVPIGDEQGAQVALGRGDDSTGTMTVDNSTITIDGADSAAGLVVGESSGSTAEMTIKNGSQISIDANSAATAKAAGESAYLTVAQGDNSHGTLTVDDSDITLSGPFVYVGIGDGEGSKGELAMTNGAHISDSGSPSNVQVGQWNPATNDGGAGKLTVSGNGTQFDITGDIDVGQGAGAGSSQGIVKVENGAEITADSINLNRGATLMGNGGIINADVNLNAGGFIAPGASPGIMTINGDLNANNGVVQIQIGGNTPGLFDQLIINGALNATDPLKVEVSFLNSFLPSATDSFDLLIVKGIINSIGAPLNVSFAGHTGSFALGLDGDTFRLSNMQLTATPIPPALLLFASALAGLVTIGCRRRMGSDTIAALGPAM